MVLRVIPDVKNKKQCLRLRTRCRLPGLLPGRVGVLQPSTANESPRQAQRRPKCPLHVQTCGFGCAVSCSRRYKVRIWARRRWHMCASILQAQRSCQQGEKRLLWKMALTLLYSQKAESIPSEYSLSYLLTTLVQHQSHIRTRDMQRFVQAFSRETQWWSRSVGIIGAEPSVPIRAHGGLELLVVRSRDPRRRHA